MLCSLVLNAMASSLKPFRTRPRDFKAVAVSFDRAKRRRRPSENGSCSNTDTIGRPQPMPWQVILTRQLLIDQLTRAAGSVTPDEAASGAAHPSGIMV